SPDTQADSAGDEYDVGYGKPPKHTRFRAGQSGNPAGRRKGVRNLMTPAVSIPEHRLRPDGFGHGVDWLRPAVGVAAPGRNEAPLEQIERSLAGPAFLRDTQQ